VTQAAQLEQRQNEIENNVETILPKVTIEDVPEDIKIPQDLADFYPLGDSSSKLKVSHFNQGTNGLVYQQLIVDMPELTTEEQQYLPLFNYCFGELGCGDKIIYKCRFCKRKFPVVFMPVVVYGEKQTMSRLYRVFIVFLVSPYCATMVQ